MKELEVNLHREHFEILLPPSCHAAYLTKWTMQKIVRQYNIFTWSHKIFLENPSIAPWMGNPNGFNLSYPSINIKLDLKHPTVISTQIVHTDYETSYSSIDHVYIVPACHIEPGEFALYTRRVYKTIVDTFQRHLLAALVQNSVFRSQLCRCSQTFCLIESEALTNLCCRLHSAPSPSTSLRRVLTCSKQQCSPCWRRIYVRLL